MSPFEIVPRGWIWSHVHKEARCYGNLWWDCVQWAFWGLFSSCAESPSSNLSEITPWLYFASPRFVSWHIVCHFSVNHAFYELITLSVNCFHVVPIEDGSRKKRGDTKDHPLSQWFMNFSEADELLQLAAARQQVSKKYLQSSVRLVALVHGITTDLRAYRSSLPLAYKHSHWRLLS